MTAFRHWLATLSVFAFGGATQSYVQPEQANAQEQYAESQAAEIRRACDRALEKNTIEALEDFLYQYPPGKYRHYAPECYALALNQFGKNSARDEHGPEKGPHTGGDGSGN